MPFTNTNAIKVFFSLENWGHPNMDRCDYAITSRSDFEHERHACLPHCITYVEKWKDILLNKPKEPEEKSKFCSYMASNPIQFRQEFFDQLSQYKFVEAAGHCKTNVEKLPLGEDLKMNYIKEFFIDFKYPCLKKFDLVDSTEEEADVILFSHYNGIERNQITG